MAHQKSRVRLVWSKKGLYRRKEWGYTDVPAWAGASSRRLELPEWMKATKRLEGLEGLSESTS